MLNDAHKKLIQDSWRMVVPVADTAADLFYRRLFERFPQYRALFGDDIGGQKKKLIRMLAFIVKAMDWMDAQWKEDVPPERDLMLVVIAMGRRHSDIYKIPDESYAAVGEALLWTFDYALGEAFTEEVKNAWALTYTLVAKAMRMGSAVVDRDAALTSREFSQKLGEEALFQQAKAAGHSDDPLYMEGVP